MPNTNVIEEYMEARQNAIVATFAELEIPFNVDTVEHRKALQKAAYLVQEAGVPLGYAYGWHEIGPYSSDLADDYQEAAFALKSSALAPMRPLRRVYRENVRSLKPFLQPPTESALSKVEWLDLLASAHFLHKYVGQSPEQTHSTLYRQKRRLSKHVTEALQALARARLL